MVKDKAIHKTFCSVLLGFAAEALPLRVQKREILAFSACPIRQHDEHIPLHFQGTYHCAQIFKVDRFEDLKLSNYSFQMLLRFTWFNFEVLAAVTSST